MTHVWFLLLVVVLGLGGFWLALRFAEAKGRKLGQQELSKLSNAELVARVKDAIRAGDAVTSDPSRLRDTDGHRRD